MQTEIIRTPEPSLDAGLDLARAQARLPRWMIGIAGAVTLGLLVIGQVRFAAGFAFGAALSVLNFRWLHQAIANLFAEGQTRVPRRVVAKLALRYPLAFATLYLFYKTEWLPLTAMIAGLFVPVGGILIEAVVQIRDGLRT
ncbi:MAG: ATP synthase subunit I [Terriglobia bacterium]